MAPVNPELGRDGSPPSSIIMGVPMDDTGVSIYEGMDLVAGVVIGGLGLGAADDDAGAVELEHVLLGAVVVGVVSVVAAVSCVLVDSLALGEEDVSDSPIKY